jgi:hypothetical protein
MAVKYLSGQIKWHKNKELDKYNKRTLDLYMDADNWTKYRSFELGAKSREDKDGNSFVTLNRKKIGYGKGGVEYELGPWQILDSADEPFDGEVWNGSDVTVKLEVYYSKQTGMNVARVEAVRVEKLSENNREPDEAIERPF